MDVLFYLGLIVGGFVWLVLHNQKRPTQNPSSPFNTSGFSGSDADFTRPFGSVFTPDTANLRKEEEAKAFLQNARDALAWAYTQMAISDAGKEAPNLLHEAFKEKWEETCWLAEAKFGELSVAYALTALRLDRYN